MGQESALSPILSAIYLSPFLHILEKYLKNLDLKFSILSFIDNGLLITQSISFQVSNACLFSSYNIVSKLLSKFGFLIEYSKTEVFHFSRSWGAFNSSPLNLLSIGGLCITPKDTWKYLEFIFDRKLSFHQHIDFYVNKAISIVKYMKILGNLTRDLNSLQKRLLYKSCALPIALYSFQLWYYSKAPLSYPLKVLGKLQRQTALWIVEAFRTAPSFSIKAITSLIPIPLHLQKLSRKSQLRVHALSINHILRSLMENNSESPSHPYPLVLNSLTRCQCGLIKGYIINMNNRFNEVFPSFDSLNPEFQPGNRIIDHFFNHFSFHLFNKSNNHLFKNHIQQLDNIAFESSNTPSNALVITDASIINNIVTSIAHIHIHNKLVIKTLHHMVNITSSEAEFFAIRYSINQVAHVQNISKIIVIMDSIHCAKKIFNPSTYSLQKQAMFILNNIRTFFSHHHDNTIEFWECSSKSSWRLHKNVDFEMKSFNIIPFLPCKNSWDFSKKLECDDIINKWRMMFQALDFKGRCFMDLVNCDNNILELTYCKGGTWLQYFGHSNTLCTRATRAITNHAPIGEYHLCFFPNEDFSCLCGLYPIETRQHILHECRRFNEYWNLRRDSITHFIQFLERNLRAFAFNSSLHNFSDLTIMSLVFFIVISLSFLFSSSFLLLCSSLSFFM